jgi:O-antigen ligase
MFFLNNTNFWKIKKDQQFFINIIFAFFPFAFVMGSFIVNINTVLFCVLGIFCLKSKIIKTNYNFIIKVLFLFFLLIFVSTLIDVTKIFYNTGYEKIHLERLIKSILFFRFFIMLITIYLLNKFNILHFKYFFATGALMAIFISFDIIFQYTFDFNVVGFPSGGFHNSSFFRDELIAGGFLLRFSMFSIFFTIFIFDKKKNIKIILSTILICMLGLGILLSGNRMPLILYFLGLIIILTFNSGFRNYFILGFVSLIAICSIVITFDPNYKANYKSIYSNASNVLSLIADPIKKIAIGKELAEQKEQGEVLLRFGAVVPVYESAQRRIWLTAIDTWKFNKIFGNGFKSFRIVCQQLDEEFNMQEDMIVYYIPHEASYEENRLCSNHPHNYFLEILTELGILGILITFLITVSFVVFVYKKFIFFKEKKLDIIILSATVISFILEIFPLRSTGSLFTTNNVTYLILITSIIICHEKIIEDFKT